ncbi:MAG: RNA methyltransferase [Ignavibacteriae bacterium]|nr:RNA methyltransferase [Ignavibacteriota bacterium]
MNEKPQGTALDFLSDDRSEKIYACVSRRQPSLSIVLENVHDPHNVSAVLRSCDAVGVMDVHLVYHSGQSFPELGEKSSASARKWVLTHKHSSIDECYDCLRKEGKKILTTGMSNEARSLYAIDFTEPIAIVFGNEHAGVSEEAILKADGNMLIPQVGMIQSLNISVACAVTLYEAFRQRSLNGMYDSIQMDDIMLKDYLNVFALK